MSPTERILTPRWLLDWSLAELRGARMALDRYAKHDGGCPVGQRRSETCSCGLDAARTRLWDAVRTVETLTAAIGAPDPSQK